MLRSVQSNFMVTPIDQTDHRPRPSVPTLIGNGGHIVSFARIRLLFGAHGLASGFLLPFPVLLLSSKGVDAATIGLVLGAAAFVSMLSFPVWGLLADGPLGRERSVVLSGLLAAAAGVSIILAGSDVTLMAICIVLAWVGMAAWSPITDAMALAVLGDRSGAYGRFRAWTSMGWAVAAISGGFAYALVGPDMLLTLFVAGSLGVAAFAFRPRQTRRGRHANTHRPRLLTELRAALVAAPVLLPILLALFLETLGNNAANAMIPLRILDVGGGAIIVGFAAAAPAIVEVPLFPSTGPMIARMGLRRFYVLGLLIAAATLVFVAVVSDPGLVAISRGVDGVSYVLRYAGIVVIIGAILPASLRATGQSLAWLVGGGISAVIAGPLAGAMYASLGGGLLFATCAALVLAGAAVAWWALRGPAFQVPAGRERTSGEPDGAAEGSGA
jgi:PPP family 3-phenylpropionic acid transporter